MGLNDDIKNIFDGEEIPFNPQHWEQLKARLDAAEQPSPFEEKAKNILDSGDVAMPAGAWDLFEQKLNSPPTPFEKASKEKLEAGSAAYNAEHWTDLENRLNHHRSNFELKAREILNSSPAPLNAAHWSQMETMLDDENGKKVGFFSWRTVSAAAAVLLLGWVSYAVINNSFKREEDGAIGKGKNAESNTASNTRPYNTSPSQQQENIFNASGKNVENNGTQNTSSLEGGVVKSSSNATTPVVTENRKNNFGKNRRNKNKSSKFDDKSSKNSTPANDLLPPNQLEFEQMEFASDAIAVNHKNTSIEIDTLGSALASNTTPDFDGQVFKYVALPSTVPTSILNNLWDNPAYAGAEKDLAVKVMYNSQWNDKILRGQTDKNLHLETPTNYYVSADAALGKNNQFGVGTYYQRSNNNNWICDNLNVSFAYNKMLSKFTLLKVGVGATYNNNKVNTSNINFWEKSDAGGLLSTYDESIDKPERYINYNAGAWISHPLYFAGVTLNNLGQSTFTPHQDFDITSNVTGGVNIPFSKRFTTTIYAQRQSGLVAAWTAGALMSFNNKFFGGLSYENSNFAAFTFGMNLANRLRFHVNGGILAKREMLYIDSEKEGFIQGGIRYVITQRKEQTKFQ